MIDTKYANPVGVLCRSEGKTFCIHLAGESFSFFCLDAKERNKEKIKANAIVPRALPCPPTSVWLRWKEWDATVILWP